MARQRFDIGSKWLVHNHGKGALLLGGLKDVRQCEPMPGELIQNRRYPDGLLRAFLGDDPKPHPVLVEIATYPERRALKQALGDLTLAYSALDHLPDLLMLVLRPKGKYRIGANHSIQSKAGMSTLTATWRTVELWTLSASEFSGGDVGILPWVPLMRMEEPPETVLERCAERIEREAPPGQKTDLLVVSQVMTQLRFPNTELLNLFTGVQKMLESPLIQKWKAEAVHELILDTLKERFGVVPRDVAKHLREIVDEKKLKKLNRLAINCPNLQAFREAIEV
jgi:hypothetical protein